MAVKFTASMARDHVRSLGLTFRSKDGEYRVAWPHDEASAYYTNDLRDACDTASAMVDERRRNQVAA